MVRAFVLLLALSVTASAADLKVLSVGAVQPSLGEVAERFKKETGHSITIQVDTAPGLTKRLTSGETADILIAPPNVVAEAAKDGKATPSTKVLMARVGIGVVARKGVVLTAKTVDALRQALLNADTVVYNEGSSGQYLDKLFDQMGIADRLKTKIKRYPNGGQVAQHILDGKGNEVGFLPIPYIMANEARGLQFVTPMPAEVQNHTEYEAVVMTGGKTPGPAQEFVRYLTSAAAKKIFAAAGVE
jgi:molybdate transport system substrate-binding protein